MKKRILDVNYLGPSDDVRSTILAALTRIPEEVANFAEDSCLFTSLGGPGDIRALVLPPTVTPDLWIVVLLESSGEDCEEAMTTVAEEVAHAWLGHEYNNPPKDAEPAASALVRSWGFRGPTTADPTHKR